MNIALVLQHKLLLGIQRFMQMGRDADAQQTHFAGRRTPRSHSHAFVETAPCPAVARGFTASASGARHCADKVMPLRVLRVVESDMPRSSTGRMVISGRMADVCAELDRLVEREAALH